MLKLYFEEIKSHTTVYLLLAVVLFAAFFVRIYRASDLMWFYYDQGRDALVIWRFWHEGDPFLVGPVTGLGGVFLGPLYYLLIAPFYLIGGGNPSYPAVFLAFTSTLAIFVVYLLGAKMHNRATGIIAATVASFSYYLVLASRWLANPTPMFLMSALLMFVMWEILTQNSNVKSQKNNVLWISISVLVSASLQFEAASAVFYIPIAGVFALWQIKNLPNLKTILICVAIFLVSLVPQITFNFTHENILVKSFLRVLFEEKSFRADFLTVLDKRLDYFWDVFSSKIFPGKSVYVVLFTLFSFFALVTSKTFKKKKALILLVIFLGVPMIGYIFFQGNYGNIYDYYMTGYYLPMVLLFSLGFGELWKSIYGKLTVTLFFLLFLNLNGTLLKNYLSAGVDGPTHITLGNELQAVNWTYEDARNLVEFNVDVYVPPVIPHSYEYLFLWKGTQRCGESLCGFQKNMNVQNVYVLYEEDPPAPERLANWLIKYEDSTILEREIKFGGVTVQRRKRI